jgi:fatty acid desaturase
MPQPMSEDEIYEEARKRVKAKKEFWSNFSSWAAVNIVLIIVWALTNNGGYMWFLWPLSIWGVFVLLHFLRAYVFPAGVDRAAIEKEAEKIKRGQG